MIEASASYELYALLKREDEKAVTERAYDNPVFVEDLVRNVALRLNAHPEVTWYKVEAENQESIHNHNAYACIGEGMKGFQNDRAERSARTGLKKLKILVDYPALFAKHSRTLKRAG